MMPKAEAIYAVDKNSCLLDACVPGAFVFWFWQEHDTILLPLPQANDAKTEAPSFNKNMY